MSKVPNAPPENIFAINLNPCRPFLVDLPPLGTVGTRRAQDGWEGVRPEIINNQPTYGERAGITTDDFDRFVEHDNQHVLIMKELPAVRKALEVLTESLAHADNQRHRLATQFAKAAETHAAAEGGNPTLLTAYEKTIAYRSIIADKAVKTRKKNEEAKKGAAPAADTDAPPAQPPEGAAKAGKAISRIPNPPPEYIFTIDLNPLKPFLVDLPANAMRGMRQEQEGWEDVWQEIVANQAPYGQRAGITVTDFNKFVAFNEQHAQILEQLPLVDKAEEILTESLAHVDDIRHKLVTQFADAAEDHAASEGGDPTLLTAYEKTIAYRSIIADKATKTRKKNEEAKKAAGGPGGGRGPKED